MKKYMIIYHAPPAALAKMSEATPEQQAEGMKPWYAWKDSLGENMIEFGSPLMPGTRINPDGTMEASTKEVTGYSIIAANDLEDAKAKLQGHPHLSWDDGCDIEVHELAEIHD
jgi:hypothetical protein